MSEELRRRVADIVLLAMTDGRRLTQEQRTTVAGKYADRILDALTQPRAERVCFGCGVTFEPEGRYPNNTQKAWCPACKEDGAADRYRQRQHRMRERSGTIRGA